MKATWHYLRNDEQVGPIPQDEFETLVKHGMITSQTKVWCEGWSHWVTYGEYVASKDLQHTASRAQGRPSRKGLKITLAVVGSLLVVGAIVLIILLAGGSSKLVDIPGDDSRLLSELNEHEQSELCRSLISQSISVADEELKGACTCTALIQNQNDKEACERASKDCIEGFKSEPAEILNICDESDDNMKNCSATIGDYEQCWSEALEFAMDKGRPLFELNCSSTLVEFTAAIQSITNDLGLDLMTAQKMGPKEAQLLLITRLPGCADFMQKCVLQQALNKYEQRQRTTEAIDQLDKIYKGAAFYYTAPRVARTGSKLPCQFPAETVCVPEGSPCDYPDNKYPADPALWSHPTWAALSFEMNDSHYYKYCFDSEGTLSNAIMTASAHADLDCDGVFSTFQRLGYGDPQATRSECSIKGSAAFYVENETE